MTMPSQPTEPRSFLLAGVWAVSAGVVLAAFCFIMVFIVPRLEKEAADQKMKLSFALEMTVAMSRWHAKYWYIAAVAIVPICLGVGAVVAAIQPRGKLRTGFWILWVILFVIPAMAAASLLLWQILIHL